MMRGRSCLLKLALLATAAVPGCESKESPSPQTDESSTRPSQPQFQPLKLTTMPATLPMAPAGTTTLPAMSESVVPATAPAAVATTRATSLPSDPQTTPESAVRYFLELNSSKEPPALNAILP